jgi:hypothetical protein
MENLNEQEHIKDPNQLDLFAGILFTPEQEEMIAKWLETTKLSVAKNESENKRNEKLLVDNGFIYGMDFINTFEKKTVTQEITLGSWYNDNQFKAELTFESTTGGIALKGKRFYGGELTDDTFSVYIENGKMQCTTIQDQYRYIKPKTLLEKLKIHSKRAETLFEEYKKKINLKQNVIEKYTELYPNATITVKKEWSKYSGDFEIIEVKFDSGSYVQFRLDTYKNIEYIYKKFDAEVDKMKADELLERFSKQVKKEGSN